MLVVCAFPRNAPCGYYTKEPYPSSPLVCAALQLFPSAMWNTKVREIYGDREKRGTGARLKLNALVRRNVSIESAVQARTSTSYLRHPCSIRATRKSVSFHWE